MKKAGCFLALVALSLTIGCSGGGDGGSGPEPEPPRILSGPSASAVAVREATIQWTTDKNATSVVSYGETQAYTDSSTSASLVVSHSVTLSGLKPASLYHYRVASDDADGRRVTSSDRTFTTLAPTGELLEEGWGFFEQAELDSALARFQAAYAYEPENVAVLEGLGWTLLRLYTFEAGAEELSARSALEEALDLEPGRLDCLVGLAFVYQAIESYTEAIATAEQALALADEAYVFQHDQAIGKSDVRYCLILSLVATGDFLSALDHSKIIDPAIDIDPDNAATWDGYSSFAEAVIMMVEGLREQV